VEEMTGDLLEGRMEGRMEGPMVGRMEGILGDPLEWQEVR